MQVSTRAKLFLSHFLAIVLVSGSIGSYFYASAIDNLTLSLQSRLLNSAALLSQVFSASELAGIDTASDKDTVRYTGLIRRIRAYASTNPDIAFIYVMKKLGDEVVFVLDSDAEPALPGEVYQEHIPELLEGFQRPSVDSDITTDKWGSFLSGYAPIHDSGGDYVIGIDMRANEVEAKMIQLRQAGIISLSVSIILAVLFSNFLSKSFNARIKHLVMRCGEIARTQLETPTTIDKGDELEHLDQTIEAMATHLEASHHESEQAHLALLEAKNELEERVQTRTQELLDANVQLREEIHERERIEAVLRNTARTDFLTGLLNRRAMMQTLENDAARHERSGQPFSLVLLDVDHFKNINDSLGHDGGDEILVGVAERMRDWIREQDVISRWGGEEFLILLADADHDNAVEQAERLRSVIESETFQVQGTDARITASLGVAQYRGEQGLAATIKDADVALYHAKKQGRNRVVANRALH